MNRTLSEVAENKKAPKENGRLWIMSLHETAMGKVTFSPSKKIFSDGTVTQKNHRAGGFVQFILGELGYYGLSKRHRLEKNAGFLARAKQANQ